jgi:hypothetical protein
MNRTKFSYLKWTPIAAGLAIAVLLSMSSSKARNQPAAAGADLGNEERVIAKYADDMVAYDKQAAELGKRARLVSSDLEVIQGRSDDLKRRLSEVEDAAGEAVKKLKAANEWDGLDTRIAANITDSRTKSFFQRSSFKQLLEESSRNLTSNKTEISAPLDNLRKKLTSRTAFPYGDGALPVVAAAYRPPTATRLTEAPMVAAGFRCRIAWLRMGISGAIHPSGISDKANNAGACYCEGIQSACDAL